MPSSRPPASSCAHPNRAVRGFAALVRTVLVRTVLVDTVLVDTVLVDTVEVRVAVLSDTHSPRFWKRCPPAVARALRGADAILHAGDVCTADTLGELASFAPVHAVLGNNDGADVAAWGAPETLELSLAGLPLAMIHDSGPAKGRAARLRRLFPQASLVIFGHSHIPWDTEEGGQRILNPGSPTDKRRQPHGTMAELIVEDGHLHSVRIFAVT